MEKYGRSIISVIVELSGCLFIGVCLLSCSHYSYPDIERNPNYEYSSSNSAARLSATGFLNENNTPGIYIDAGVAYGSLAFKKSQGREFTNIAVELRVVAKEKNRSFTKSNHYKIDIEKEDEGIVANRGFYFIRKQIKAPPGRYEVSLTVTDLNSDKKFTRLTNTSIPDPVNKQTRIRMLGKNMDADNPQWLPITTYSVAGRIDSLLFLLPVSQTVLEQQLTIHAALIRFKSDLSVAQPVDKHNYSPSSIQYKGIDYASKTVVQQEQRKLFGEGGDVIKFRFEQQDRGNYRFKVTLGRGGEEQLKAYDFGVRSTNYPYLKTARELARPLAYLMEVNKYAAMMAISHPDSLQEMVDRFWLKHIGNKNEATKVLQMYYQRVVEANRQFATYKEGWKTDSGMIYMLFGPPVSLSVYMDRITWSYSDNLSIGYSEREAGEARFSRYWGFYESINDDSSARFDFYGYNIKSAFSSFQYYLLDRGSYYAEVLNKQQKRWLAGKILQYSS